MNFMNAAYDGERGIDGPYKEYIPEGDVATSVSLARILRDAIKAVRGTDYDVGPAYSLYPTSGSSEDYFYSRHFTDGTQTKITTFTLEWGRHFTRVLRRCSPSSTRRPLVSWHSAGDRELLSSPQGLISRPSAVAPGPDAFNIFHLGWRRATA